MAKKNIQSATLVVPKMKTKKVWIGSYFNHYNGLVIFHKKPKYSKEDSGRTDYDKWIDMYESRDCVAATVYLDDFVEFFPGIDLSDIMDESTGNAKHIVPVDLIEAKLTAVWDDNRLGWINFDIDGY